MHSSAPHLVKRVVPPRCRAMLQSYAAELLQSYAAELRLEGVYNELLCGAAAKLQNTDRASRQPFQAGQQQAL